MESVLTFLADRPTDRLAYGAGCCRSNPGRRGQKETSWHSEAPSARPTEVLEFQQAILALLGLLQIVPMRRRGHNSASPFLSRSQPHITKYSALSLPCCLLPCSLSSVMRHPGQPLRTRVNKPVPCLSQSLGEYMSMRWPSDRPPRRSRPNTLNKPCHYVPVPRTAAASCSGRPFAYDSDSAMN